MKNIFLPTLLCAAALLVALAAGCAREVSHTESDRPGWFGGHTSSETTVYQNPDGTTSTEHTSQSTK